MPRTLIHLTALALLLGLSANAPAWADGAGERHSGTDTHEAHADHAEDDHAHDADHDDHGHDDHGHDDDHGNAGTDTAHAFSANGVKVTHPWVNATRGREALIYLELENTGTTSVSLLGAEVPFATEATLVGFAMQGGEGTYQPLPFVPVQPGRELELAPQGLAILATGLTKDLVEGGSVKATLLTSAGAVDLLIAVEAAEARQHSHAGHAH